MKVSIKEKAELFQVEELQERLEFSGWTTGVEITAGHDDVRGDYYEAKATASKSW